jgi:hypothetical protein
MHTNVFLVFTSVQQRCNLEIAEKVMTFVIYLIHLSVQIIYEAFTNAIAYDPILGNGEVLWKQGAIQQAEP